jgi:hypothetical protein
VGKLLCFQDQQKNLNAAFSKLAPKLLFLKLKKKKQNKTKLCVG